MSGAKITDAAKSDLEKFFAEILSLSIVIALKDEVTFCTSLRALKIEKSSKSLLAISKIGARRRKKTF